MFVCCDNGYVIDTLDDDGQTMELHESAAQLNILFHVLHHLPEVYVERAEAGKGSKDFKHVQLTVPETIGNMCGRCRLGWISLTGANKALVYI